VNKDKGRNEGKETRVNKGRKDGRVYRSTEGMAEREEAKGRNKDE
jgi:hypothetical protein